MIRSAVLLTVLFLCAASATFAQTAQNKRAGSAEVAKVIIAKQKQNQTLDTDLVGMPVHHSDGSKIGTLDGLLFDEKEKITGGIVSFGGFLGIGRKSIALSWDALDVREDAIVLLIGSMPANMDSLPRFRSLEEMETAEEIERARELMEEQQKNRAPQQY